jgi:hypothetical protein
MATIATEGATTMSPTEAARLLGILAAYDGRKVTQADAVAWAAALPDVTFPEAAEAARRHGGNNTERCKPAHIRALVYRHRDQAAHRAEQADIDAAIESRKYADRDARHRAARQCIAEYADALGQPMPDEWIGDCPWCGAHDGQPCTDPATGRLRDTPHPSRPRVPSRAGRQAALTMAAMHRAAIDPPRRPDPGEDNPQ